MFSEDGITRRAENEAEHFLETLSREEDEMRDFVFKECMLFHLKHHDHLVLKIKTGYYSVKYILMNIETREKELLTEEETLIFDDL